ncbi:MAG: serine/threonine-protein kinase, partial [Prosthecobacter sp.]
MTNPVPSFEAPDTTGFGVAVETEGVKDAETSNRPKQVPRARSTDLLKDNDGWIDGKFHLIEKLGEGGFGLVYRAEQTQPIHRQVAVKILKAGMDTQQVIARFATERQSLAVMEHPNIARVLDAGETERGQPYFVMELVRGQSITSYANKKKLTIQQRIELFILVCHAVNHAHQKGIIHRDLKPSNVMVMEEDGEPTPKVIDFGIAKVLEQKNVSQTLATGMDQLVGTPGYISPEQIERGSSHVDTRSDVYALGSILLELLSGKPLVSAMDMAQKPMHQILRDQVELDPPRPSSREPLLKGDLDWIILKALEKDPARRYGNADDLADDLRRYLHDQPVRACPPSKGYLIGKFVRRHRVGVAAGLAVALTVLAGGITSTALYLEAEENRVAAQKASSVSDGRMAGKLTEINDYVSSVALLCRALRTDPDNEIAATNLLSLLEHEHFIQPATPNLPLPQGATEARLVTLSPQMGRVIAISSPRAYATAAAQDVLSLWDMTTHQRTDFALSGGVVITSLLVSKDGRYIFMARDDGQIMQWSLEDDSSVLLGLRMPVSKAATPQSALCLALSGDGHLLAAGGDDGTILAWDLRQPDKQEYSFQQKAPSGMKTPITGLNLDNLGTIIASTSNAVVEGQGLTKGIVSVWDVTSGQMVGDSIQVEEGIGALAVNWGAERVAIGLNSGVVHVLN